MIRFIILLFCLITLNSKARALEVSGVFKQGGILAIEYDFAKTKTIKVGNKNIFLSKDGLSYVPVGRNDKTIYVSQTLKNGTVLKKNFNIEHVEYKTQNVKGVKKKHVTPDPKHLARIKKESKQIRNSRKSNIDKMFSNILPKFDMPLNGKITGVYGSKRLYNGVERSWHKGLDIAEKRGIKIFSPSKGKVVLAMKDSYFNGNLVILDHGKKIYTIYAHMCDILVSQGDIIQKGDVIGTVGSTGRSTGPHLHWGVYVGQQAINPEYLLNHKSIKKEI